MRIILITGDGPGHRYVANRLAAAVELAGIIVDQGRNLRPGDRILRLYRKYTAAQLASRSIWALASKVLGDRAAYERAMLSVLGPENCTQFSHPHLLHYVCGLNTADGIKAVSGLEPDAILVYGTGIVGKQVLSRAAKIALNMHTGISPYYRGCDCYFWPLYNGELHMLGATVHECVKEVDGGRIFGTAGVQLEPADDIHKVFARCISAGADLYVKKVREMADHDLQGTVQDLSIGMEYKAHQKGLLAEWKVRRAIRSGLIRRFAESAVQPPAPVGHERSSADGSRRRARAEVRFKAHKP